MLNSVEAGRRLILRAALYPLAAVVVLALAFLVLPVVELVKLIQRRLGK